MSRTLALPDLVEAPPADDLYFYGHRHAYRRGEDGSVESVLLPLTLWDVLHPQEEDKVVQSIRHQREVRYLVSVIEAHLQADPHVLVFSDTAIYWDEPGLSHHCPDVAVVWNVPRVQEQWTSFHVSIEGVRPGLIIEVVSPHIRTTDTYTKRIEYHKARVPLYVIIDREKESDWPSIVAYRYDPAGYVPLALDDRDCLLLEDLGMRLCVNQNRITLYDATTGNELGDYAAIAEALDLEVAAREAAEEQASLDREARLKAEEATRQAEEAARKAESRAKEEATARADLERQLAELRAQLPPSS